MANATAHPNRKMISSEDVHGTSVFGVGSKKIGDVDHILIDKSTGRVAYAVVSFGGFLGLGHSHYPVPWSALKYDTTLEGYVTGITESQLKDAPAFGDDNFGNRNSEAQYHQHYGAPPYWAGVM